MQGCIFRDGDEVIMSVRWEDESSWVFLGERERGSERGRGALEKERDGALKRETQRKRERARARE